jgi:hypothetical protein
MKQLEKLNSISKCKAIRAFINLQVHNQVVF